ncbi:MAG: hypothetical protein Mars2KO_40700 [Maribacter sp.]|uniref:DUF4174 domain-containing protein n=1 Tax=Maribacter sp. 2307UL18-2 TaxID=3386274 RepID=UPI0039BCAA2B
MRSFTPLLILLLILLTSFVTAQDLDTYQWKNRIILLKESDMDSDWLKAQVKRLQSDMGKLNERQLLVFIISNESVYDIEKNLVDLNAQTIVEHYGLDMFNGLALIGKDGGIKMKEDFIVNPKIIFELIDSMPMRQAETQNR